MTLLDLSAFTPPTGDEINQALEAYRDLDRCMFDLGFIAPENTAARHRMSQRVARNLNTIAILFRVIPPQGKEMA